jgi:hypothetical protein
MKLIRHPKAAAGVQHFLGEEEAVLAIEVADRTGRFRHQVKSQRRVRDREDATGRLRVSDHPNEDDRGSGFAEVPNGTLRVSRGLSASLGAGP